MKFSSICKVAALVVLACGCRSREFNSETTPTVAKDFDDEQAMELGVGYSVALERGRPSECVSFTTEDSQLQGQEVKFSLHVAETQSELASALNVSAAAMLKAADTFGLSNFSSKASYVSSKEVTQSQNSIYVVVHTTVLNQNKKAQSVAFTPKAKRYLEDLKKAPTDEAWKKAFLNFRILCGDMYLKDLIVGGEYYGVIHIQNSTSEEKKSVKANIEVALGASISSPSASKVSNSSGSGLIVGREASASLDFSSSLRKAIQNKSVNVWSIQRGGSGDDAVAATTVDELIQKAKTLPKATIDSARVLRAVFFDYTTLDPEFPYRGKNVEYLSYIRKVPEKVEAFLEVRQALAAREKLVRTIIEDPKDFRILPAELESTKQRMQTLLSQIQNRSRELNEVLENAALQFTIPQISPSFSEPLKETLPPLLSEVSVGVATPSQYVFVLNSLSYNKELIKKLGYSECTAHVYLSQKGKRNQKIALNTGALFASPACEFPTSLVLGSNNILAKAKVDQQAWTVFKSTTAEGNFEFVVQVEANNGSHVIFRSSCDMHEVWRHGKKQPSGYKCPIEMTGRQTSGSYKGQSILEATSWTIIQ